MAERPSTETIQARLESEARQSDLSRQLAESQLKLLQLQVEPHFLFNTLASARQLAERGAPDAAKLIGDLVTFLRAVSPSMREARTSLGAEADLVRAYLSIMRTRLGRRLDFAVAIPAALHDAALPPGMLITLVENAIKHGIEPWPPGGRVDVTARAIDDVVELEVADTGAGLDETPVPGTGIGLATSRAAGVALRRPRDARLGENEPRGFRARACTARESVPTSAPFVPVMAVK
jgi:sensor histidine kinase YesM